MATFGKTSTGSQNDEIFSGFKVVSSYTLSDSADVTKLTLDCDGLGSAASGTVTVFGVIYSDSGGLPGTLLGETNALTITHTGAGTGQARAQNDLVFPSTVTLTPGTYWLGFCQTAGPSQGARYWAAFASGHGKFKSGGISDTFGTPGGTLDEDVAVYATYTVSSPSTPSISITSPADGATISGTQLVTMSVAGTPHHVQLEISHDGTTWERLCAKNRLAPWEANFGTRRFDNSTYQLRAKYYTGSAESTLSLTSSTVGVTISNSGGTTRTCNFAIGNTFASAISAASAGDTILVSGVSTNEGSLTVNKSNLLIKSVSSATINSRIVVSGDGVVFQDVDFGTSVTSPLPIGKATTFRRCDITNGRTGIGFQDASTIPFDSDGAFDTLIEDCTIHDCGDQSDPSQINQAHGIYAQNSTRLFVRNTYIYRSAARNIQLYPQALQATIYKCALYDAEMGVGFGGDTSAGAGMGDADPTRQFITKRCTVERCIIGKGGGLDASSSNGLIYSFWGHSVPVPVVSDRNEVLECWLHDPPTAGVGAGLYIDTSSGGILDAGGNITGTAPGYTNAANDNFTLVQGAAALGYGPDSAQAVAVPADPYGKGMFFADVRGRWNTGSQGRSLFYSNPLERDG